MIKIDTSLLTFDLVSPLKDAESKVSAFYANLDAKKNDLSEWLGWVELQNHEDTFASIEKYSKEVISSRKFDNLVIFGIGGSALGPQALTKALLHPLWNQLSSEERKGGLRQYCLDNVDPDWTEQVLSSLDPNRTLYLVITKSGGTAETGCQLLWAMDKLKSKIGEGWKDHIVVVTDPQKGTLRALTNKEGFTNFQVPPNVGGRFSVFSAVGLLPMALAGIDIRKFQKGLKQGFNDFISERNTESNIAIKLAVALTEGFVNHGKFINPLMPYSTKLSQISDWYVQLVAESLGKTKEIGPTPIKAVGATDQHSQLQLFAEGPKDKLVFFIEVDKFKTSFAIPKTEVEGFTDLAGETLERLIHAQRRGTAKALFKNNVPSITLTLSEISEETVAYLLYAFEVMTAIAGALFEIDPFNQPGVELSKKYTYALLGKKGYESYLADCG